MPLQKRTRNLYDPASPDPTSYQYKLPPSPGCFLASPGATFCNAYCNGGFLALVQSGKIIYGGHRDGNVSFVAARINSDGTLDTTFGTSGAQYVTASGQTSFDGGPEAQVRSFLK